MVSSTESWVGQSIADGRYEVIAVLGEGGMGCVYRARDHRLHCDVVIKVPRAAALVDPEFVQRFHQEITALVQLSHPHIVKVSDVGQHDGYPFAVMQYLPGGNLDEKKPEPGRGLSLAEIPARLQPWLLPVADGLDYIHGRGFIHRDIKPANILFDATGNAFISDFGVAKVVRERNPAKRGVTQVGQVLGTPEYMAPEIIMGRPFDGRADQYALAVTVYEVLAGKPPFTGPTPEAVLVHQTTEPVPSLSKLSSEVPKALVTAIERGLAKVPTERFPDCRSFARAVLAGARVAPSGDGLVGMASVDCPNCGKVLRVPTSATGRRILCPACRTVIDGAEPTQSSPPPSASSGEAGKPAAQQAKPSRISLSAFPSHTQKGYARLDHAPEETSEPARRPRRRRKRVPTKKVWVALACLAGLFVCIVAGGTWFANRPNVGTKIALGDDGDKGRRKPVGSGMKPPSDHGDRIEPTKPTPPMPPTHPGGDGEEERIREVVGIWTNESGPEKGVVDSWAIQREQDVWSVKCTFTEDGKQVGWWYGENCEFAGGVLRFSLQWVVKHNPAAQNSLVTVQAKGSRLHFTWTYQDQSDDGYLVRREPATKPGSSMPGFPPPPRPPGKFLADMEALDVRTPREGTFFKRGVHPSVKGGIQCNGIAAPNSLWLHPPSRGTSSVRFQLDRAYSIFIGAVAINDSAGMQSLSDVVFEVWCDEEKAARWKSTPGLQATGSSREFDIPVGGVRFLELRARCDGNCERAHAVWLEPRVTMDSLQVPHQSGPSRDPTTNPPPKPSKALRGTGRSYMVVNGTKNQVNLNGNLTAELWVRMDPDKDQYLMGDELWKGLNKDTSAPEVDGTVGWVMRALAKPNGCRALKFEVGVGGTVWLPAWTEPQADDGGWHHIAMSKSRDVLRLFWDGQQCVEVQCGIRPFRISPADFWIGAHPHIGGPAHDFHGHIGAFRLSSSNRYLGSFEPSRVLSKEPDTLVLFDFLNTGSTEELTGKYTLRQNQMPLEEVNWPPGLKGPGSAPPPPTGKPPAGTVAPTAPPPPAAPAPLKRNGLRVDFFEGRDFQKERPELGRVYDNIDFTTKDLPAGLQQSEISMKWTAWLLPPKAGQYELIVRSDDGFGLWLGPNWSLPPLMASWKEQIATEKKSVRLKREPHLLRVHYFNGQLGGVFKLCWKVPGSNQEEVVPTTAFFLSRDDALAAMKKAE